MIKKEDINIAIRTFKEWDNQRKWTDPPEAFKHHTLKKSENALKTAQYLLKIMEDKEIEGLFSAELGKAKTSISRAIEFGDIIKEYIKVRDLR